MGGLGGQPANFVSGVPVSGTGDYYYNDSSIVGLVSTEDMVVMMDEMGIETNLDIDKMSVHDIRCCFVLETFPLHHMTPVAGCIPDAD